MFGRYHKTTGFLVEEAVQKYFPGDAQKAAIILGEGQLNSVITFRKGTRVVSRPAHVFGPQRLLCVCVYCVEMGLKRSRRSFLNQDRAWRVRREIISDVV